MNYNIYDLIPFPSKLETLFILESPHKEEVKSGIPCVGETGKEMSRVLLNNNKIALGRLLKAKCPLLMEYGVMNTFHFPLKPKTGNKYEILKELDWKKWKYKKYGRNEFYKEHYDILNNAYKLENDIRFKERLLEHIKNSPKLNYIVICGFIAQSVFRVIFNMKNENIPYNDSYKSKLNIIKSKIIFVNHPSPIDNNKWEFKGIVNYL